jgi:GntR family transcriptional regulator
MPRQQTSAPEAPALDREGLVPLYYQLEAVLEQRILEGVWGAHERLPSERALCEEFGVSRAVVRPALEILERQGHVVRIQGSGTFVAPPKRALSVRGLVPTILAGVEVNVEMHVLSAERRAATKTETPALGLARRDRVLQVFATLSVDERPACMYNTTIALDRAPFVDALLREGARLRGWGPFGDLALGNATVMIEGGICTELEADQLALSPGAHVMVANILQDASPGPVESAWVIYPAESVRLGVETAAPRPAAA